MDCPECERLLAEAQQATFQFNAADLRTFDPLRDYAPLDDAEKEQRARLRDDAEDKLTRTKADLAAHQLTHQ